MKQPAELSEQGPRALSDGELIEICDTYAACSDDKAHLMGILTERLQARNEEVKQLEACHAAALEEVKRLREEVEQWRDRWTNAHHELTELRRRIQVREIGS